MLSLFHYDKERIIFTHRRSIAIRLFLKTVVAIALLGINTGMFMC
jgi:hypothetical protein